MEQTSSPVDLDAVVAQLRDRVAQRRARGDYPEQLTNSLELHFRHFAAQRARVEWPGDQIEGQLAGLDQAARFDRDRFDLNADSPAKKKVHELVAVLVNRQILGVLEQSQAFADATRATLRLQWDALRSLEQRQRVVEQSLQTALDKLARYERGEGPPEIVLKEVQAQLASLVRGREQSEFSPWYSQEHFEAEFRGTKEDVKNGYRDLVAQFQDGPVLDIGFGRGEVLELLQERGIDAVGVEVNREWVERARDAGFDVQWGNGLDVLAGWDDQSLGGIFLGQVVEHLSQQELLDLVAEAARTLRPGGLFVAETVNPQSLYVYAHSFYLDPTHVRPVHPSYLFFLLQEAGFAEISIDWRSPVPPDDVLQAGDADAERINRILFATQDYAVVGRR